MLPTWLHGVSMFPLLLAISTSLAAPLHSMPVPQVGSTQVERDVLAAERGFWSAVNECDVEKWDALVSEDLIFVMGDSGAAHSKRSVRGIFFKEGAPCPGPRFDIEPLQIRVFGDVAIVNGNFLPKGPPAVYTRVLHKENGVWRVVSVHHHVAKAAPWKAADGKLITP